MKYDARACHFNMDTGCVELLTHLAMRIDSEWRPGEIFEECGWEPWVRNLNECWILLFFNW